MNVKTTTYTPDSVLRDPRRLIGDLGGDVHAALRIGIRLAKRDLDAQYRQTFLGYLWAVAPIALTAGLWILLDRSAVLRVETGSTPYWLFVLTGTVAWQVFIDALAGPLSQFQANRLLLVRVNFPKEALLVSAALQAVVSLAFRMVAVVAACLFAGVALAPSFVLAGVPFIGLLIVGTVIGTLLVPAGALFGDVHKLVLAMTAPLMLVAPVAYPVEAVQGGMRTLMEVNPLTPLIILSRDLLLALPAHSWAATFLVMSIGSVGLLISWLLYRVAVPVIIEKFDA